MRGSKSGPKREPSEITRIVKRGLDVKQEENMSITGIITSFAMTALVLLPSPTTC
jgi:hypothetical protein